MKGLPDLRQHSLCHCYPHVAMAEVAPSDRVAVHRTPAGDHKCLKGHHKSYFFTWTSLPPGADLGMPPALQLVDRDFVSNEGPSLGGGGLVLLFPGREEEARESSDSGGGGERCEVRSGSKHRWARRDTWATS